MQVAVWTSTGSSAGPPGRVRAWTEQTLRRRELDVPSYSWALFTSVGAVLAPSGQEAP